MFLDMRGPAGTDVCPVGASVKKSGKKVHVREALRGMCIRVEADRAWVGSGEKHVFVTTMKMRAGKGTGRKLRVRRCLRRILDRRARAKGVQWGEGWGDGLRVKKEREKE